MAASGRRRLGRRGRPVVAGYLSVSVSYLCVSADWRCPVMRWRSGCRCMTWRRPDWETSVRPTTAPSTRPVTQRTSTVPPTAPAITPSSHGGAAPNRPSCVSCRPTMATVSSQKGNTEPGKQTSRKRYKRNANVNKKRKIYQAKQQQQQSQTGYEMTFK